jgi:hypothetical protein
MLRQQEVSRVPDFAGMRVRLANVIVEIADRVPLRPLRRTFSMLDFDIDGALDVARLNAQQLARMDDMLRPMFQTTTSGAGVIDVASRFVARGGSWQPDAGLLRRIDSAAMGHLSCARVRVAR